MARRRALPQRSSAEWAVRVALAVGAALIGSSAVTHSLAYAIRGKAPERAYAIAPNDGRITAILSEKLSAPEASAADRARGGQLALNALRQDPTAVAAAATLGINAQIQNDIPSARRWFAYSEKLSRRDLRTRLWAIEDAVSQGDIPGAIRSYDIALRTSPIAPELLFPILTLAITDPVIRDNLVRTLAKRPAWGNDFIGYATANGQDSRVTASLFDQLQKSHIPVPTDAPAALVNRLVAEGYIDDAWSYYATLRPAVERNKSRDTQFTADPDTASQFDWVPMNEGGIAASIQQGKQGGLFDFAAPPSVGGWLLRQMQALRAGDYKIEGRSAGIEQPMSSRPYWALSCVDGRELGRVYLPNSTEADGQFAGRFAVPTGCPAQYLTLVARASDLASGLSGQILEVRLHPASRR